MTNDLAKRAKTTYRVLPQDDKTFLVEITLSDGAVSTVPRFSNAANAEIWVDARKLHDLPPPIPKAVRTRKA